MSPEALARLRESLDHPFYREGKATDVRTEDLRALLDAYDASRAQVDAARALTEGTVSMNHKSPGDLLDEAYERGRAEGVAAERVRVVAWLRGHLRFWRDSEPEESLLGSLIGRYERGEHDKEGA